MADINMQASEPTVMDALRLSTADMHTQTEGQDFQRQLGSGTVQKEQYVQYLGQLYLMHKHLGELLEKATADSRVAAVLAPYHTDLSAVSADLQHFGVAPGSVSALAATKSLLNHMDEAGKRSPLALLGLLYVLEGSTNGAKFMAKTLRQGLDLPEDKGASYFDRYGDKQRERWTAFKETMNKQNFDQTEIEVIVAEAKYLFQSFFEIGTELISSTGAVV
jgi:heme oxygenase